MFVILAYYEGECYVWGPYDTEALAYEFIGRTVNGDRLRPKATLFVRPVEPAKEI